MKGNKRTFHLLKQLFVQISLQTYVGGNKMVLFRVEPKHFIVAGTAFLRKKQNKETFETHVHIEH